MAGSLWSKEAVSVLIDEYQKHPCLYVVKSPLYHNRNARRDAEKKISDVVSEIRPNTNSNEVKAKINGLRTQVTNERNKYMKSHHSGMGLDDTYKPSFAWYERMLFLVDRISARNNKSNLDSSPNENMQGEVSNEETKEETASTSGLFIDYVLCVYEEEEEENKRGPSTASNVRLLFDTANESGESSKKRRKKTSPEDAVLASAATALQSFRSRKDEDDDDDFARFIASSVRKIKLYKYKPNMKF